MKKKLVASLVVTLGSLSLAAPARATVIWRLGDTPPPLVQSGPCGNISFTTDPVEGKVLAVRADDCNNQAKERAEFSTPQGQLLLGNTYYVGWKARVNIAGGVAPGDRNDVCQSKSYG